MKQIALDGKKDPPFGVKMIIWFKDGQWIPAYLKSVVTESGGKKYVFVDNDPEEYEYDNATHYCIPTEPKK